MFPELLRRFDAPTASITCRHAEHGKAPPWLRGFFCAVNPLNRDFANHGRATTFTDHLIVAEVPGIKNFVVQTALGGLSSVDHIVGAAIFLASDASRYITGTTIVVDGGYLAQRFLFRCQNTNKTDCFFDWGRYSSCPGR